MMARMRTDPFPPPTIGDLPAPPDNKNGWPWIEESKSLQETLGDGSIWPRVTIVTPSYNQGKFIEATIRSVLLQGYPNLEYIIMDGGSTDDTLGLIQKYEKWLSHWSSTPDNGQGDAINKGWQLATGDIWTWLNSDDLYTPNAIHTVVSKFNNHPEIGMAYGNVLCIDHSGEHIGVRKTKEGAASKILWTGQQTNIMQPAAFVRADVIKKIGYLDINLRTNLDYEFFIRIIKQTSTLFIPENFALIHIYKDTKSLTSLDENWTERLTVIKKYNPLWFISPIYFKYLRYQIWKFVPQIIKNRFRLLRKLPRDIVHLDPDT